MNTYYDIMNFPDFEHNIIANAPNCINVDVLQVLVDVLQVLKAKHNCQTFEQTTRGRSLNQDILDKIASHVIGIETNSYLQKIQEERDLELLYGGRDR